MLLVDLELKLIHKIELKESWVLIISDNNSLDNFDASKTILVM